MRFKYTSVAIALAMLGFAGSAQAKDSADSSAPVTVSGDIGIVSDYRFRGVSLSNNDFAVQGGVTVSTQPGFYASAWASNIADYGGAKAEIDLTAGWSGPVGPLTADVNVVGYFYPGGEAVNYYELAGSLSKAFGPLEAKVGVAYSPKQDNIGGVDNTYLYGEANYAITGMPVTLNARIGHEDGVYTGKTDYSVGADVALSVFTLGVSYIAVDSDPADELGDLAGDKALVTLKASF